MRLSPLLNPLDVLGSTEVVLVLGFLQPTPLTSGFTGFAALGFTAIFLTRSVARVRPKQLVTITTLFPLDV